MNHTLTRAPHHHLPSHILEGILHWIAQNAVLCVAAVLALVTSCIVPPDAQYADYIDWKTISCLFSVLAVVCALKNIRFFTFLAKKIVECTGNLRAATVALVYITFIGSMLIANDMALLTFLPLGYYVLSSTGKEQYMARIFILQNIAANLGGMLTPFGNPQNLYLYSFFNIPTPEFLRIMLPTFLMAVAMITACCLALPKEPITLASDRSIRPDPKRTVLYLVLFALAVIMVFRILPYLPVLLVILAVLLLADRRAVGMVDYPLLLTFVCFFIFAGNMSRIPAVSEFLTSLMNGSALVVSAISCQFISNVPSAILLSRFTGDYQGLLLGVNIGGTGTLIASLASLITFREYTAHHPEKTARYLGLFSAYNFGFLAILLCFALVIH